MRAAALPIVLIALVAYASCGAASDACSQLSITTAARVEVSDGSTFNTESFYQSADTSAIRHIDDEIQIVAVEGPVAWAARGGKTQTGGDNLKNFALGHQYHALLLHYDEVVSAIAPRENIAFGGAVRGGKSGDLPFGGKLALIQDGEETRPAGLLFELPDTPPIEVHLKDWRDSNGRTLPFHVQIDDGSRRFDYFYTKIEITEASPIWFFEAVPGPDLNRLQIHRLHRRILAAHCMGDADLIADLTAPDIVVASRGELHRSTREETRERFTGLFERLDYTGYHDLLDPVIEVSEDGGMGWIAVNVRAVGAEIGTGTPFDSQWSWIMLARKIDGSWLHAGNASSLLQ